MQRTALVRRQDHRRGENDVVGSRSAGFELDVLTGGDEISGQRKVGHEVVTVEEPEGLTEYVQVTANEHLLVILADVHVRVREATEHGIA
jgi:hypothetical protein